mmetsp:Transcript_30180/g.73444  ORF Transcript_30180/g.73444 Transcript_30180/m.73444 type:complete len:84 (+) Transcript_30180:946-1197(+)
MYWRFRPLKDGEKRERGLIEWWWENEAEEAEDVRRPGLRCSEAASTTTTAANTTATAESAMKKTPLRLLVAHRPVCWPSVIIA